MAGWQPIETAPRNNGADPILIFCPGGFMTTVVWWNTGWTQNIESNRWLSPTHWMPLPESPK